jgi:hypothetical protein
LLHMLKDEVYNFILFCNFWNYMNLFIYI